MRTSGTLPGVSHRPDVSAFAVGVVVTEWVVVVVVVVVCGQKAAMACKCEWSRRGRERRARLSGRMSGRGESV